MFICHYKKIVFILVLTPAIYKAQDSFGSKGDIKHQNQGQKWYDNFEVSDSRAQAEKKCH